MFFENLHFSTFPNKEKDFPGNGENVIFFCLDFESKSPLIQSGFSSAEENNAI